MKGFLIAGAVSTLLGSVSATPVASQASLGGEWLMGPDSEGGSRPGRSHLVLSVPGGGSIGLGVGVQEFQGLAEAHASGAEGPFQFQLRRGAGTLVFSGSFRGGRGSGSFAFTADPEYAAALQQRGLGRPTPQQQLSLAVHDVDLAFVDAMVQELTTQGSARPGIADLPRLRRIDPAYVRELGSLGYRRLSPEQLVRLHNHGVSAGYVRQMQALGYPRVSPEQLVRLRNRRVTPEFVRQANAGRTARRSVEELIRLRDLDRRG